MKTIVHTGRCAVLLRTDTPEKVMAVIPTARELVYKGIPLLAVPHRLDETRVLRSLGFDVPSPVKFYYEWSGRYKPFQHQRETAEFATLHQRCYLLLDMGAGKTLTTLWAFDYLRSVGQAKRMLVTAPLSTLERTWADEVFHHFPHLNVCVLHGSADRRRKLLASYRDYDVLVINHHGMKVVEKELADLIATKEIDLAVIDELAVFRNSQSGLWKTINALISPMKWVWGLTGSPTPNAPTDAYGQVRLLTPQRVPKYFNAFRDKVMKQINQFKWIPRADAHAVVADALQPAIRFKRDECIDLPPTTYETRQIELTPEQKHVYKEMLTHLYAELSGEQVLAVNEAVKASKLIQICCIAENTPVLTQRGWVAIQSVTTSDLVWDGEEWVTHAGSAPRGIKPTIVVDGVHMTTDHLVLTTIGWVQAGDIQHGDARSGFDRVAVRLPDGYSEGRDKQQQSDMAMCLRLRSRDCSRKPKFAGEGSTESEALWLPERGTHNQARTRHGENTTLSDMVGYATALQRSFQQRLAQLWRTWHSRLCRMGRFVSSILERHEGWLCRYVGTGSDQQRWQLRKMELSLGGRYCERFQPTNQQDGRYTKGSDDCDTSRTRIRNKEDYASCTAISPRVGNYQSIDSAKETYDILNCGPRNRFVVKGCGGELLIVHNCGTVYSNNGEEVVVPAHSRIEEVKEIIEQAEGKVIVFVPFTGALHALRDELGKHFSVAMISGEVPKNQRDEIFGSFQNGGESGYRVLVAQPAAMAHGLTLTAANVVVWFAPVYSNEIYEQANARICRPGQKRNTLIVHIQGAPIEAKIYSRLRDRGLRQASLLQMIKEEMHA